MLTHRPRRSRRLSAAVAALLGFLMASAAVAGHVDAADPCVSIRPYGLRAEANDRAWATAGRAQPVAVDTGNEVFTLVLTDRQAQYVEESLAGGCTPQVKFATRATTGALGFGTSFYTGSVSVSGGAVSGSVSESGSHPLGECHVVTCFEINEHRFDVTGPLAVGSTITVTGTSFAMALANGPSTLDQAHADWRVQFPVLLVPIP